jgi:hypothetical protein
MAWLLAVVILAITLSPSEHVPPPRVPPSATTTDVTQSYRIDATLDVGTGVLQAIETITLVNRAGLPIDYVNLSVPPRAFGYVSLDGPLTVDGTAVDATWTTGTNLKVMLGTRLAAGATAEIRMPFTLRVGASGGAFTARTSRDRGVLSFGQWLPMISPAIDSYAVGDPRVTRAAELIRLDLTTTTPLPRNAVACPGLVSAPETSGSRWSCEIANARDVSFVVDPAFRLTTRSVDGIDLRVYTHTVDGGRTADLAMDAVSRLNVLYGRYPWPDLVLAEVGADGGFSMEYPAAIHLTRTKVTDAYVLYHEVAHQWFYAQLGNDQQREPWVDEGFADFTARYLMGIGENQCSGRPVDSSVFDWPAGAIRGGDWLSCDGYFHAVFYKSTEFLNAVRGAMGNDAFFAALRDFIATHRYGLVTGRELLEYLAARSEADLGPIYARYLAAY